MTPSNVVRFKYLNYRGEVGMRRVIPQAIRFEETVWHPGVQWILDAYDLDQSAVRSFAMKDISQWTPEVTT